MRLRSIHEAVERRQQRRATGNGWPSSDGSTRHCPRTPSTTAGSPASPTSCGSPGHSGPRARASPSERSRSSSRVRLASSAGTTSTRGRRARRGPTPVPALVTAHRDLAAGLHHLQQPADVAVVVPPRGPPRLLAGVRQVAGALRTQRLEPVQEVAPAGVVGRHPVAAAVPPVARRRARPGRHVGEVQGDVLGRAHRHLQLDQHARGQRRRAARPVRTRTPAGSTPPGRRSAPPPATWSTCSSVRCRTTSCRSVGRSPSSSCARTAMRRASCRDSSWTVVTTASLGCTSDRRGRDRAGPRRRCGPGSGRALCRPAQRWPVSRAGSAAVALIRRAWRAKAARRSAGSSTVIANGWSLIRSTK